MIQKVDYEGDTYLKVNGVWHTSGYVKVSDRKARLLEGAAGVVRKEVTEIPYPDNILAMARAQRGKGHHHVYVVRLEEQARQLALNLPNITQPELPPVYVGKTGLLPEERFRRHKNNLQAGKGYVRDYGIELMPSLYDRFNPMSNRLAEKVEPALAAKLRLLGYPVLGGT